MNLDDKTLDEWEAKAKSWMCRDHNQIAYSKLKMCIEVLRNERAEHAKTLEVLRFIESKARTHRKAFAVPMPKLEGK